MTAADPLLRARDSAPLAADRRLTVFYDERPVPAGVDDTVTSALLGAGIVATGRSLKYRRPRGPFCLQGDCGTCLVRIDGIGNARACMTPVREGMHIAPQNRLLSGAPDPTALVDRMFAANLDHHHFMVRPKLVNRMMQEVARNLAGLGVVPDRPAPPARWVHHTPDVLVVGAGRSGMAATRRLRAAGLDVACVDRFDARWSGSDGGSAMVRWETPVFGVYPADERVAAIEARAGDTHVLRTYRPTHLVIATGARDVMLPVCNNDLPGVFAARGVLTMLARSRTALAAPGVVIGEPEYADPIAARLGAERIAPADVRAVLGGGRVEAVATAEGKREIGWVGLAAAPAPVSELARQLGARVAWNGGGFAIVRDELGRCADGPWSAWACGEACGVGPDGAADDGERVAEAIVAAARGRVTGGAR